MSQNEEIKYAVMKNISGSKGYTFIGRASYLIGSTTLHVRFCSTDSKGSPHYKFNINPNTLNADYEVWICGDIDTYYLLPNSLIKKIYEDPEAYVDSHHPKIRIVSVNVETNTVTYATGGKSTHLLKYLNTTLG